MSELLKNPKIVIGVVIGVILLIAVIVLTVFSSGGGDTAANFGQGNNFQGANVNQSKTENKTLTNTTEINKEKK